MSHRISYALLAFASVLIAAYAFRIPLMGEAAYGTMLRESFSQRPFLIAVHAGFGGLAIVLAALQLHKGIRLRNRSIHRVLGRLAVPFALVSGGAGLWLAFYAMGGPVSQFGFGLLGIFTLICPLLGWKAALSQDFDLHRRWMLRTFGLLFAAVTLRIELPLLAILLGGEFITAYRIVAWLCWVPNVIFVEYILYRSSSELRH
jgi:uncharacterized membrane protein